MVLVLLIIVLAFENEEISRAEDDEKDTQRDGHIDVIEWWSWWLWSRSKGLGRGFVLLLRVGNEAEEEVLCGVVKYWKIGPFSAAQHQQKNERKSAL